MSLAVDGKMMCLKCKAGEHCGYWDGLAADAKPLTKLEQAAAELRAAEAAHTQARADLDANGRKQDELFSALDATGKRYDAAKQALEKAATEQSHATL